MVNNLFRSDSLIYNRRKSGIMNIGNTCWLNSILQVLASNNEFCEKIQPLRDRFFSTLSQLLSSIRNPRSDDIEQLVRSFKEQLEAEFPYLQDPKEMMTMISAKLSEVIYNDASFNIFFTSLLHCHDCSNNTIFSERNIFIIVPRNKYNLVQDFLANLRQPITWTGDNKLYCENCNGFKDMTFETEDIDWPSTVAFYLPSQNRDFEINEELNIDGTNYKLYGLICNFGGDGSEHNIAYTWDTEKWTEYNDSIVRNASLNSIDKSHLYLAFYAGRKPQ